jgi:hypothetical protein
MEQKPDGAWRPGSIGVARDYLRRRPWDADNVFLMLAFAATGMGALLVLCFVTCALRR